MEISPLPCCKKLERRLVKDHAECLENRLKAERARFLSTGEESEA
jgi:hypothetical protein